MDTLHPDAVPLMSFRSGKQKGWLLENRLVNIQAVEEQDGSIIAFVEFGTNTRETATFNNWAEARDYLAELLNELDSLF